MLAKKYTWEYVDFLTYFFIIKLVGEVFSVRLEENIQSERHYSIVKSNKLIQQTRYNLSTTEQKIILYLLTKIKPEDHELQMYEFQIRTFCDVCGINYSGKNYTDLKSAVKKLADKSLWVKTDDGGEALLRWLDDPYIEAKRGTLQVRIGTHMRPYLLNLKEHFTKYEIYYILAMKSQYSIRVYELLKSYEYQRKIKFEILDFKKLIGAEKYKRHADFTRFVLNTALKEINEFGDIYVNCDMKKEGRAYKYITFIIRPKEEMNERLETWEKIEGKLNPKQVTGQISMYQDGN